MGCNDFGGKFVVFGNNICRNGKEGERKQVRSQEEAKINQRQERWVGKHGDAHL